MYTLILPLVQEVVVNFRTIESYAVPLSQRTAEDCMLLFYDYKLSFCDFVWQCISKVSKSMYVID